MQIDSKDIASSGDYPLYDARWEHDACGTGFLAHISGLPSHLLIEQALTILTNLTHRGAQDADAETNDGAGLLTQVPRALLVAELQDQDIALSDPEDLAVGVFFLPNAIEATTAYIQARRIAEQTLLDLKLPLLTWRNPPLDLAVLGARARATAPTIEHVLLARPAHVAAEDYERTLYQTRRIIETRWQEAGLETAYIASFSSQTIVYKGLLAPSELSRFYLDLADSSYASSFAIFHQR